MSKDAFGYALFTMQTGHRPMSAFSEIFEHLSSSLAPRFDNIESESGSTRRHGLEVALSDTAILMTYSLIEGFFFEEYRFYFDKDPPRGKKLEETIKELLTHLRISDGQIGRDATLMASLRIARNAIAHRNGALKDDEKVEIKKQFGTDVSTSLGYPVATIPSLIEIINKAEQLISEYSEAAVRSAAQAQPIIPPDAARWSHARPVNSNVARELMGTADQLVGFHQSMIKIEDSEVVKISGKTHHPIVKRTDRTEDRIAGTVFEITDEELANVDKYEVADYKRVSASLANLISPRLLDKPTFNSL